MNILKSLIVVLLTSLAFSSFGQNKVDTLIVKTRTYCDHCKVCESCGGRMETDLVYVKGIKLATYNEDDMTVEVIYRTKKISPDQIRNEIANLGFEADGVPANSEAYTQLDTCCKKK